MKNLKKQEAKLKAAIEALRREKLRIADMRQELWEDIIASLPDPFDLSSTGELNKEFDMQLGDVDDIRSKIPQKGFIPHPGLFSTGAVWGEGIMLATNLHGFMFLDGKCKERLISVFRLNKMRAIRDGVWQSVPCEGKILAVDDFEHSVRMIRRKSLMGKEIRMIVPFYVMRVPYDYYE